MKKLTERTKDLLLMGAREMGEFALGLCYIEEQIYIHQHPKGLYEFCKWIDKEIGGGGPNNIEIFWQAFNHPNNKEIQTQFENAKKISKEVRYYWMQSKDKNRLQ